MNKNSSDLDSFNEEINKSIDHGNPNILLNAIKKYKHKIDQEHIDTALNIYNELISEIVNMLVIA